MDEIQGWMSKGELCFLRDMAIPMKSIVEIGSWKGRSTKVFLDTGNHVFAIDHWKGSDDPTEGIYTLAKVWKIYDEFMGNCGHYPNLTVFSMDSREAVKKFSDRSVDMVFIDATHTYEAVKEDITLWYPKAKKVIACHDYSELWPGVIKAVDESLGEVKAFETIAYKEIYGLA